MTERRVVPANDPPGEPSMRSLGHALESALGAQRTRDLRQHVAELFDLFGRVGEDDEKREAGVFADIGRGRRGFAFWRQNG